MKAERDQMLPEDERPARARGKFASRFTPEEREVFLRESAYGMVRSITGYALGQIRGLEGALFSLIRLAEAASHDEVPRDLPSLVDRIRCRCLLEGELVCRLQDLVSEREYLLQPRDEVYTGPGSFTPIRVRLEDIYNEARALKDQVETLVEQHLARSGMSAQEIERQTEETARLWAAA